MSGSELLLEYLTRYFPILFFVIIALTFGCGRCLSVISFIRNIPNQRSSRPMSVDRNHFRMLACPFRFGITFLRCCS